MISFEEFKKIADDYFNRTSPEEVLREFEAMGYEFEDTHKPKKIQPINNSEKVYPLSFQVVRKEEEFFPIYMSYTILAA